jgi:hypothetical protein
MAGPGPVDVAERRPDQVAVEIVADPIELQHEPLGETSECRLWTIRLNASLRQAAVVRGSSGSPRVGALFGDDHTRFGGLEPLLFKARGLST